MGLRRGLLVLGLLAALGGVPPYARAASACVWAWRDVPTPPAPGGLSSIAADSASDAWAVGSVIEHWDGQAWTSVPAPVTALTDVAALSPTDAWAVASGRVHGSAVAEHWNGNSWSRVAVPRRVPDLAAISAVAADDVWFAGDHDVIHRDGTSWNVALERSDVELHALKAFSAQDVWAVGETRPRDAVPQALALHWDGRRWRSFVFRVPDNESSLDSVVGMGPNDVWAGGGASDLVNAPPHEQSLLLHWDGRRWTRVHGLIDGGGGYVRSIVRLSDHSLAALVFSYSDYAFGGDGSSLWYLSPKGWIFPEAWTSAYPGQSLWAIAAAPAEPVASSPTPDAGTAFWGVGSLGGGVTDDYHISTTALVRRYDCWNPGSADG
jgi:hypothetical protein